METAWLSGSLKESPPSEGLSVQTLASTSLNTEWAPQVSMRNLTSAFQSAAWWLQSATQVIPFSQLSCLAWLMFLASGSLDLRASKS